MAGLSEFGVLCLLLACYTPSQTGLASDNKIKRKEGRKGEGDRTPQSPKLHGCARVARLAKGHGVPLPAASIVMEYVSSYVPPPHDAEHVA